MDESCGVAPSPVARERAGERARENWRSVDKHPTSNEKIGF